MSHDVSVRFLTSYSSGYSFNLDGTTLYLSLATIFSAQAAGMNLPISTQLSIMGTLMLSSKGVAAIPRASLVVLSGTLSQYNIPLEAVLMIMGVPVLETACILALGGVLGMIAPPTNIPAMIIGAGIDIPYSGFGLPLTMLTFPLAFLFVLMFGYKYVKNMNYVEVEAKLNTDSRKRFGFKVYIPLLLAIVLMVLNKAVPAIPDIGMPLVFLISAVVGCFTGYKFNFFKAAKESVHSALPVMGILMGVGMFIQVMTLTGVRGLIVTSCLSLPSFARYLALAISMPAFGAISSFGSASVLGVPFLLSFLAKDQIIVAAALSLVASLGDMVPPTALAGIFAAKVVGMENYTPILKKCLIPCLIVVIWAILFIVFADQLSFLTLS